MNPRVQFEDEADVEYRLAGRWYEDRTMAVTRFLYDVIYLEVSDRIEDGHCARSPQARLLEDSSQVMSGCRSEPWSDDNTSTNFVEAIEARGGPGEQIGLLGLLAPFASRLQAFQNTG